MFSATKSTSESRPDAMQTLDEMRDTSLAEATQSLGGLLLEERMAKEIEMKACQSAELIHRAHAYAGSM